MKNNPEQKVLDDIDGESGEKPLLTGIPSHI